MGLHTYGARKYSLSALLGSSAGLGWSAISAELHYHGVSETPMIVPQRLRRALDHISAHLDEKITLGQLAQVAGVSVFHFARTFTRTIGVSPSRYVSRMRLERAMVEIAAGKLCLAEIAFRAGFSSQASFTRAFCRVTGLSPGEYRKHWR